MGLGCLLTANGHGTAAIMAETGAFEAFSPATKNRRGVIQWPDGCRLWQGTVKPLSYRRNKHRSGWGRIFMQLKANGLLNAKTLGELMSECYQQSTAVISV